MSCTDRSFALNRARNNAVVQQMSTNIGPAQFMNQYKNFASAAAPVTPLTNNFWDTSGTAPYLTTAAQFASSATCPPQSYRNAKLSAAIAMGQPVSMYSGGLATYSSSAALQLASMASPSMNMYGNGNMVPAMNMYGNGNMVPAMNMYGNGNIMPAMNMMATNNIMASEAQATMSSAMHVPQAMVSTVQQAPCFGSPRSSCQVTSAFNNSGQMRAIDTNSMCCSGGAQPGRSPNYLTAFNCQ